MLFYLFLILRNRVVGVVGVVGVGVGVVYSMFNMWSSSV